MKYLLNSNTQSSKTNRLSLMIAALPVVLASLSNNASALSSTFNDVGTLSGNFFVTSGTTLSAFNEDANSATTKAVWIAFAAAPSAFAINETYSASVTLNASDDIEFLLGGAAASLSNWQDASAVKAKITNASLGGALNIGRPSSNDIINISASSAFKLQCVCTNANSLISSGDFGWVSPVAYSHWKIQSSGSGDTAKLVISGKNGSSLGPIKLDGDFTTAFASPSISFDSMNNALSIASAFTNAGTLNNYGSMYVDNVLNNTGTLLNSGSSSFMLIGDNTNNSGTFNLTNNATMALFNSKIYTNSGTVSANASYVVLSDGSTCNNTNKVTLVGSPLSLASSSTFNNTGLTSFDATSILTNNGTFNNG